MSWTECHHDECQTHLGSNQGSGWYPQCTRRLRQQSFAHDYDWGPEMEVNPGEDWAPKQPRPRRARRASGDLTSWENWFNDKCHEYRLKKVDAGY